MRLSFANRSQCEEAAGASICCLLLCAGPPQVSLNLNANFSRSVFFPCCFLPTPRRCFISFALEQQERHACFLRTFHRNDCINHLPAAQTFVENGVAIAFRLQASRSTCSCMTEVNRAGKLHSAGFTPGVFLLLCHIIPSCVCPICFPGSRVNRILLKSSWKFVGKFDVERSRSLEFMCVMKTNTSGKSRKRIENTCSDRWDLSCFGVECWIYDAVGFLGYG